jgi:hypothetical protein
MVYSDITTLCHTVWVTDTFDKWTTNKYIRFSYTFARWWYPLTAIRPPRRESRLNSCCGKMSMFRRLLLVWNVEHKGYLTGVRFLRRSVRETATFFRYKRPFVDVAEYTRWFSAVCPISVELLWLVTVFTELPFSLFTTVVATSLDILLFDVRIEFNSLPLKQTDETKN